MRCVLLAGLHHSLLLCAHLHAERTLREGEKHIPAMTRGPSKGRRGALTRRRVSGAGALRGVRRQPAGVEADPPPVLLGADVEPLLPAGVATGVPLRPPAVPGEPLVQGQRRRNTRLRVLIPSGLTPSVPFDPCRLFMCTRRRPSSV